ncbi:MAG: hypothetical protein C0393_04365 [Anaerolinea sp.]|nr:hypothetical protein [Anaerolinea sp.]
MRRGGLPGQEGPGLVHPAPGYLRRYHLRLGKGVADGAALLPDHNPARTGVQVHVGEVFKPAIRRGTPAIIVVHNHPSGDPTPSPEDVATTRGIVQAGKLLDIDVLDHMVIGQGRWVSLKERGLGFA